MIYDIAVVGLGGMGSAVLANAARRGASVIGLEQFERLHDRGASSGKTRIIRKAYFEHPSYVPLLFRAYELWRELERETSSKIVDLIGLLTIGAPESTTVEGTLRSARMYDLPLDELDAAMVARNYAGVRPRANEIGLLERDAGIVYPEIAIDAHLRVAEANGAKMAFQAPVQRWQPCGSVRRLHLVDGSMIDARRVVVCAGPWSTRVLSSLGLPLRVQRNVQIWFKPSTHAYDFGTFPAYFVDRPELPAPLYGFPATADGLKAALHAFGEDTQADRLDRDVHERDIEPVRAALEPWMPGSTSAFVAGKACMYTLTPDGHFVIDINPHDEHVVVAGGFSGHGFKFCPVVGEIATDLALDGKTRYDIAFLSASRFAKEREINA